MNTQLTILIVSVSAIFAIAASKGGGKKPKDPPYTLTAQPYGQNSALLTLTNLKRMSLAVQVSYNTNLSESNPEKWGYLFTSTQPVFYFTNGYVFLTRDEVYYRVVSWPTNFPPIPPIPAPENP